MCIRDSIVAVQSNLQQSPTPELALDDQARANQAELESTALISENIAFEVDPLAQQLLQEYISNIEIDEGEPPLVEHIQDSPLFRLVNELQTRQEQQ